VNKRVREFLSRIQDDTGTVRRYSEALENEPPWTVQGSERCEDQSSKELSSNASPMVA